MSIGINLVLCYHTIDNEGIEFLNPSNIVIVNFLLDIHRSIIKKDNL